MIYLDYNKPIVPNGSFKWAEYARLQEWDVFAIPTKAQADRAFFLFTQIERLIRQPLGKELSISSGARTDEYTAYLKSRKIPAATGSAHNSWEAVDLRTPAGMTNAQFWQFCHKAWPGRMENLIHTPSWVHLDIRQWSERIRFNP